MPVRTKKILIIGLGNPDSKYEFTRHNFGFRVLDRLQELLGLNNFDYSEKYQGLITEGRLNGNQVYLVKPTTYMNKSGLAALAVKKKFSVTPANIWVIHDDKDLELGDIRLKDKGSSAGHKGVDSIIEQLGTKNFKRMRLGVWSNAGQDITTDKFVLSKFSPDEEPAVRNTIDRAAQTLIDQLKLAE